MLEADRIYAAGLEEKIISLVMFHDTIVSCILSVKGQWFPSAMPNQTILINVLSTL